MKKSIALLLTVASILSLSSCFLIKRKTYTYRGEFKELYTTAIYSIPDAKGYMYHGEGAYSSDIYVWERDDYGRTLFAYCEDYSDRIFGLVICQSYDDSSVYFYPDENYALVLIESDRLYEGATDDHLKNRTQDFYLQNKDSLKEKNDWNKPLDKSKCVSYSITDRKAFDEDTFSFNDKQCNEILNEYTKTLNFVNPTSVPHRNNSILQVDKEGRILHEINGVHGNYDKLDHKKGEPNTYYHITLWVITDKYGNYDKEKGVFVVYSKASNEFPWDFVYTADAIAKFKNDNGWKN
ncbi:MAG: hypothetical protein E7673_05425 [Ruminococcaceae bacterium]|nr:hypothetical protein [Oscillospiraceae bacterium]